jgi:predicted HTH transcriptional regulator
VVKLTSEEENARLVSRLLAGEGESECVEYKKDNAEPERIGQYISALANSAALHGQTQAYLLWGVEDATRKVVGTTVHPETVKVGNESLVNWLTTPA